MAAAVLPDSSNFLGIALVVNRSRDGPRFVFHYPPDITPSRDRSHGAAKSAAIAGSAIAADELDDEDDVLLEHFTRPASGTVPGAVPGSERMGATSSSSAVPWEHVAGYPTKDLESLLTPSRAFHKKLFQVSLERLYFVSYPVYVPESGIWKSKKRRRRKATRSQTQASHFTDNGTHPREQSPRPLDKATTWESQHLSAAEGSQDEADRATDAVLSDNEGLDKEEKKSGMTMFNVVFILNPKKHEAGELIDTLYSHIIKKINKAYKYSQEKSDFMWKESKGILALKDKGRERKTKVEVLWKEILQTSSLAASIQDVYEAISHNRIAALQLETAEGPVTHSVQIPVPFYVTDLPSEDHVRPQGLWITTANSFVEDSLDDPGFLDRNFALLLISDEKKVIAELQADSDETTAAMVEFVRLTKPTMSIHQIGHGNTLSPAQVRKYAQHFIFWRRAIAIPPLHARDVYIMSPNSNASALPQASRAWTRAFPLAPPLPNFLADLSVAPRSYKSFAPSKSHRPTYLQMLAWLMRGGWVTQLCTFAYVVVWPEILYEVEYQLEADELKAVAAQSAQMSPASPSGRKGSSPSGGNMAATNSLDDLVSPTGSVSDTSEYMQYPQNLQHQRHMSTSSVDSVSMEASQISTVSASSERTAFASPTSATGPSMPDSSMRQSTTLMMTTTTTTGELAAEKARLSRIAEKSQREAAEKAAAHARKPVPTGTPAPSKNSASHLSHLQPYIIVDAKKATGHDSLYLSAIGRRFKDPKVQRAWPVFWKYFNGRTALERIALQEDNMKRKEAWALLTAMSEHLVTVRHW
ncbi:nitrogen permease regulator of amino acid transport activity 3-domain-containing protein [Microdochium trichocladiopsis]|uniref:Nitrogen permease regulator 3 n=1 Tax=Microdochium trichocladiopsis TaxID=1682393 RepID=A0A9P8Y363_9PEZI|nr:nitrogen permease regulator of amino acid transport activity 3-domain-containing protein [Microdochium trichocladiopsis]KAH7026347.1 nitrogen permease regulator of amino acid transport activity 3-domain-containing protein [Microdochium trichocladiopsis]